MTNQVIADTWTRGETLEAVVWEQSGQQQKQLSHYWSTNSPRGSDIYWQKSDKVISKIANSPGAIIKTKMGGSAQGSYEVLVGEGDDVAAYFRDNSGSNWSRGQVLPSAMGPASWVEYILPRIDRNTFDAVLRDRLEPNKLWHWQRDNRKRVAGEYPYWQRKALITASATGPGCIALCKDLGASADLGRLVVVVPEHAGLMHYYWDYAVNTVHWQRGEPVIKTATATMPAVGPASVGPACIIETHRRVGPNIVPGLAVAAWVGDNPASSSEVGNPALNFYVADTSTGPWTLMSALTQQSSGPCTLVQPAPPGFDILAFILDLDGTIQIQRSSDNGNTWSRAGLVGKNTSIPKVIA